MTTPVDEQEQHDFNGDEYTENKGHCFFKFHIPCKYHGLVIGKQGSILKEIQRSSGTAIRCKGDLIEITGDHRKAITDAITKVTEKLKWGIRKFYKSDIFQIRFPGYFLSIPVNSTDVCKGFEIFKEKVLKIESGELDENLFQIPAKLHLTLSLLAFFNEQEIKENTLVMTGIQDLLKKHLTGVEMKLHVKGIDFMKSNGPTRVLYAKVHANGFDLERLQSFANELVSLLQPAGFTSEKQYYPVTFHVTIMNVSFLDGIIDEQKRSTIDAHKIVQELGDFDFGEVNVSALEVSIMGKYDDDGSYQSVCSIPLI